jgi:hypothetical protein
MPPPTPITTIVHCRHPPPATKARNGAVIRHHFPSIIHSYRQLSSSPATTIVHRCCHVAFSYIPPIQNSSGQGLRLSRLNNSGGGGSTSSSCKSRPPLKTLEGGACLFSGGGGEEILLPWIRGVLIVVGLGACHAQMRPKGSPHESTHVPRLRCAVRWDDKEVLRRWRADGYLWSPDTRRNQGAGTVGHALRCGEILWRD